MPAVAAVAMDFPTLELSNADQAPSTGALDAPRAGVPLDPAHRSVASMSTPPVGAFFPAVFLLHSSFLL